ncbi:MAG: MarR family transcriptional regulator [Rhodobacterales bacterium]|nr:MarR family transcriptional regulator [Rhodobacterales bacterium]
MTDARAALESCPALALRQAARRATRALDAALKDSGLTLAQAGLLARVATAPDDTIGALAAGLDLDPSTLSRTLRGLEKAGLVEIALVETDLRRRAVWLTEAGARRLAAALPAWRAAQARV